MWRFQLGNSDRTYAMMSEEERREFKFDVGTFTWDVAFVHHIYGLRRYYLKEDILSPVEGFQQLLQKGMPDLFHDVKLSNEVLKNVMPQSNTTYFADIMLESNFQRYVLAMTQSHSKSDSQHQQQTLNLKVKSNNRFLFPETPTIPFDRKAAAK